ncbi:MAG TPA: hypothetical protein VGV59_02620 [Pyrinomonadaceae bacterium]|nr:hypothetical protein [Pyrinomonadaceae bacterium]
MRKRRKHHREHYTGSLEERDTARLSEMLAPPEEKTQKLKDGAIVVDASKLKVPNDFSELDDGGGRRILGFEPVVLAIVVLVAVFICFVGYLISVEPSKQ